MSEQSVAPTTTAQDDCPWVVTNAEQISETPETLIRRIVGTMLGCAIFMDTPNSFHPSAETEKVAAVPHLVQTAREVAAKMTSGTRRDDRDESSFVRHVQAADSGISIGWRWAQILVVVIGFGFTIGTFMTQTAAMKDSISELRSDMRDYNKQSAANAIQLDRNTRDIAARDEKIADLSRRLDALSSDISAMRNMREAYVYDSAKAARNKLLQQATTPP